MLTTGSRAFKGGTVSLYRLKGCKITVRQTDDDPIVLVLLRPGNRPFFKIPYLTAGNFEALSSTETHGTSLERS